MSRPPRLASPRLASPRLASPRLADLDAERARALQSSSSRDWLSCNDALVVLTESRDRVAQPSPCRCAPCRRGALRRRSDGGAGGGEERGGGRRRGPVHPTHRCWPEPTPPLLTSGTGPARPSTSRTWKHCPSHHDGMPPEGQSILWTPYTGGAVCHWWRGVRVHRRGKRCIAPQSPARIPLVGHYALHRDWIRDCRSPFDALHGAKSRSGALDFLRRRELG
jgi:hypothetical protein